MRRQRSTSHFTLGLAALALIGCAAPAVSPTVTPAPPSAVTTATPIVAPLDHAAAARGAQAFTAWCNSCHPGGGVGHGPALWGARPPLTAERIRAQIRHSDPREVARFRTLTDAKLNDIIAFILERQAASQR